MNIQTTSVESPAPWWQRLLARKLYRAAVSLASYMAASAIATALLALRSGMPVRLLWQYLLMKLLWLPALPVSGLAYYLDGQFIVLIGWLIYLSISIAAVVIKSRRVFVALYIIFIILLAMRVR